MFLPRAWRPRKADQIEFGDVVRILVRIGDGDGAVVKTFRGRAAWALYALIAAGAEGCTPITRPAPRWSHYVFLLRRGGIDVETIQESHGGAYSGHHARYILRSPVIVLEAERADAGARL